MTPKRILLIGAGQIGSRHLQALARADFPIAIDVVEPSPEARQTALERFGQIAKSPAVESPRFHESLSALEGRSDLAIIATNSRDRLAVLRETLDRGLATRLILEKVLFPSVGELDQAAAFLSGASARAWVNCPKRAFPEIKKLREKLEPGKPFRLEVTGSNWGLGCNAIHFLDLAAYWSEQTSYELDLAGLDREVQPSKRAGYFEFTGTMRAKFSGGSEVTLTSLAQGAPSFTTVLVQGDLRQPLSEAIPQSELTQRFAREILLEGDRSSLPSYDDSARLHRPLIAGLLSFYNQIQGQEHPCLPIT